MEAGIIEPNVLYALTAPTLIETACEVEGVVCIAVDGMTLALQREPQ